MPPRPRRKDPSTSRTVNVGLIGQRFMGRAHSNAWSQVGRYFDLPLAAALHTVAARDPAPLPAFARRWGWRKGTARWQDLADDPEIGLVDVSTPNHLHAEQSLAMLAA